MQALAACASLQSLDLSNNGLDSDAPRHLAASESLEALRMGGNPLGDAGAGHLAHPEGLARIRILALDNCAIEDLGALALAAKPGLEELSLANRSRWTVNRITDTAGEAFASSRSLRKLDLAHCEVGNRTARRLAASQSLKDLGLSGTRVDDAGGTALAASETLRKVDLSGTNVGDETAIAMARNPVIRKLDLSGCPNLTEKGRAALEAQRHRFEELRL
jgi:Leucine-rich repeat (LRR) protein